MASVIDLVREDLRGFSGYRSARSDKLEGGIWLNANESPYPNPADAEGQARRYPDPQPAALRQALADLYGCQPEQLLAGRGSDEAIDLLIRALCRPGADSIVVNTPTFGMYAVCARLHGTRVIDVPLREGGDGFACDFEAMASIVQCEDAKILFLCSPGNPTGSLLPLAQIEALATRLEGRALVVVDEAYAEYAQADSAIGLISRRPNIAVLRTLSKAYALAGVRLGTVIADAALITVLRNCQAPYPLPTLCADAALKAIGDAARSATSEHVATVVAERNRLYGAIAVLPGVRRVYPSRANFLLVRFDDAEGAFQRLLGAGIVVRDMRAVPGLGDALRITVGTPAQNAALMAALTPIEAVA